MNRDPTEAGEPTNWRKSRFSGTDGGNCVELGTTSATLAIRDSKQAGKGPWITVSREAGRAFMEAVREGGSLA